MRRALVTRFAAVRAKMICNSEERLIMNRIVALVIVVVLLLFAGSSTLVVVDQRHVAVVYSRGQSDPVVVGPGLHFKLPTPIQGATRVDMRIQTVEIGSPDRYTTSD